MEKLENWRERLEVTLAQKEKEPFKYGHSDCTTFTCDAIQAQTGIDIISQYRGKYKTLNGGLKLVKKDGYSDHIDLLSKHLNEVPKAMASTGDICILAVPEGYACGVVIAHYSLFLSETGLQRIPNELITKVFKL